MPTHDDDQFFETYAAQMRDMRLPDTARARILNAVCDAVSSDRAAATAAPATNATARRPRLSLVRNRTARRIIAVAACTLVLAMGALALTVLDGSSTSAADGTNDFTLAAYADGTPLAENPSIVNADMLMAPFGSWGTSESHDDHGNVNGEISFTDFAMDLRCTGENIKQLVYRLDGPDGVELRRMGDREDMQAGDLVDEERGRTLTVDNSERMNTSSFGIGVKIPLDDELLALNERVQDGFLDELMLACKERSAQVIGQCTLTVTATLQDNSTITHVYRIAPVENIGQVLRENYDAAENARADDEWQFQPEFTIEQLS